MNAHDDLVRSLLVERFRSWPPTEAPSAAAKQLAAALNHEKRRGKGRVPRRRTGGGGTIDSRRQP